jgi:hypothetical protein
MTAMPRPRELESPEIYNTRLHPCQGMRKDEIVKLTGWRNYDDNEWIRQRMNGC